MALFLLVHCTVLSHGPRVHQDVITLASKKCRRGSELGKNPVLVPRRLCSSLSALLTLTDWPRKRAREGGKEEKEEEIVEIAVQ